MHYNILFNGCSFTLGSELEGIEKNYAYRDLNRFSHIISEKTGRSYKNIAHGGISNDRIVRTTIEWFEAGNTCDYAIIQFSVIKRTEYVTKHTADVSLFSPVNFSTVVGCKEPLIDYDIIKKSFEEYYKYVYNEHLGMTNFYKNLFILEQYFKTKRIKKFFIKLVLNGENKIDHKQFPWKSLCEQKYEEIPTINEDILLLNDSKENYCKDYSKEGFPALNGYHPSELGHQKIADYIIKHANL
jgi:hypothetical protein